MSELIVLVEEAPEGGFTARAVGEPIFTEADTVDDLREKIRDAVRCHFGDDRLPAFIRLYFVREEVITVRPTQRMTFSERASAFRRNLAGRHHSDSTKSIRQDRDR